MATDVIEGWGPKNNDHRAVTSSAVLCLTNAHAPTQHTMRQALNLSSENQIACTKDATSPWKKPLAWPPASKAAWDLGGGASGLERRKIETEAKLKTAKLARNPSSRYRRFSGPN